jgi:hypothetical protein
MLNMPPLGRGSGIFPTGSESFVTRVVQSFRHLSFLASHVRLRAMNPVPLATATFVFFPLGSLTFHVRLRATSTILSLHVSPSNDIFFALLGAAHAALGIWFVFKCYPRTWLFLRDPEYKNLALQFDSKTWWESTEYQVPLETGILRISSGFGVFAEIFSKNIMIPSREIPLFGEAPQRLFWAIITKFGCIRVSSGIRFFGYSGHPQNRITEWPEWPK